MGYRVVYGPMPHAAKKHGGKPHRIQALTAACLLVFSMTVRQIWPEGKRMLCQFLLPGEPTVTETAFQDMMEEIREGEPLGDAFTTFCKQIIEHEEQEVY